MVMSAWAGTGASATLDAGTWRAAWQDLEELVEQGHLPCRGCSSSSSPESRRKTCPTQEGRAPVERSAPSPGPVRVGRASSALKMHVARKGLETRLGTLPVPVQLSHQRGARQQSRRMLPKLIQPGQSQPLPRRGLCPSLQAKAKAIAENIKEKEDRRLWGDPNPTEESLALLVPCPPPLLAPLDPQLPREHSVWGPRAVGQASAVGHATEGQWEPHSRHGSEEKPASQRSALGNVVSEGLLRLDGGLSPWDEECLRPFALAMAPPALPSLDNGAAGPEAGSAAILPKEDVGHMSNATTRGGGQANTEDRSRPHAAAPVIASRLELSQEVRSKLRMHIARKSLEIKLQRLPMAVQQSTEMLQQPLPKLGWAGAGPLQPCRASPPLLTLKRLVQPERDTLQQLGASLPRPRAPTTLDNRPEPVHFHGPGHREEGSQAALEASTLPSTSCSFSDDMDTAATGAVLRTHRGVAKASAGQASTLVSPGLGPAFPATDSSPEPWRGAHAWVPHGGCVAPAPRDPQGHWGCRAADGEFHPLTAAIPPEGITSTEGTASQYSPFLQQRCSAPVTRLVCSCHLRPARDAQDTAAVRTGNTLRSVLEKICQRRRNTSASLGSSASEHSCCVADWQGQASCSSCSSKPLWASK